MTATNRARGYLSFVGLLALGLAAQGCADISDSGADQPYDDELIETSAASLSLLPGLSPADASVIGVDAVVAPSANSALIKAISYTSMPTAVSAPTVTEPLAPKPTPPARVTPEQRLKDDCTAQLAATKAAEDASKPAAQASKGEALVTSLKGTSSAGSTSKTDGKPNSESPSMGSTAKADTTLSTSSPCRALASTSSQAVMACMEKEARRAKLKTADKPSVDAPLTSIEAFALVKANGRLTDNECTRLLSGSN